MKILKSAAGLLLAASLIFSTGCGKTDNSSNKNNEVTTKVINLGAQDGAKYSNDFFGLELNVPEEWHVANDEEKAALMQAGQDAIAENNEKMAKQLDLAKEKTLNLMFAFKHPLPYQGVNPNVLCMAENLDLLASTTIKSGKDYIAMTKTNMEQTGMPYTFGDISTEKLGNKDFDVIEATLDTGDIIITQKYYASIFDEYALVFVCTFSNEDEALETKGIMDSVTFK